VNKEDIWVARISLPVKPDDTTFPTDDFAKSTPGAVASGWNLYSPKWAPVSLVDDHSPGRARGVSRQRSDSACALRLRTTASSQRADAHRTPRSVRL
jgi:hypothetical protein